MKSHKQTNFLYVMCKNDVDFEKKRNWICRWATAERATIEWLIAKRRRIHCWTCSLWTSLNESLNPDRHGRRKLQSGVTFWKGLRGMVFSMISQVCNCYLKRSFDSFNWTLSCMNGVAEISRKWDWCAICIGNLQFSRDFPIQYGNSNRRLRCFVSMMNLIYSLI
jgi:hypothetical protein